MEHAFEWPRTEVIERGKYLLDRRVFWRNGARDLIALTAALLLGMSLFEIMLISVIDALFRVSRARSGSGWRAAVHAAGSRRCSSPAMEGRRSITPIRRNSRAHF
jgi:hypothetical protein